MEREPEESSLSSLVNEASAKPVQKPDHPPLFGTDGMEQNGESVTHSSWWLAVYVLRVARAHEEAYDKAAADKATKDAPFGTHVDYKQFQTKTIHQCAEDLLPEAYVEPVYYLLQYTWNDIQDWAVAQVTKD